MAAACSSCCCCVLAVREPFMRLVVRTHIGEVDEGRGEPWHQPHPVGRVNHGAGRHAAVAVHRQRACSALQRERAAAVGLPGPRIAVPCSRERGVAQVDDAGCGQRDRQVRVERAPSGRSVRQGLSRHPRPPRCRLLLSARERGNARNAHSDQHPRGRHCQARPGAFATWRHSQRLRKRLRQQ